MEESAIRSIGNSTPIRVGIELVDRWSAGVNLNKTVVNVSLSFLWAVSMLVAIGFMHEHGNPMDPETELIWARATTAFIFIHLGLAFNLEGLIRAIVRMANEKRKTGSVDYGSWE